MWVEGNFMVTRQIIIIANSEPLQGTLDSKCVTFNVKMYTNAFPLNG